MSPSDALVFAAVQLLTQAAGQGHVGATAALTALDQPTSATPILSREEEKKALRRARNERYRNGLKASQASQERLTTKPESVSKASHPPSQQASHSVSKASQKRLTTPSLTLPSFSDSEILDQNKTYTSPETHETSHETRDDKRLRVASQRDDVSAVYGHWLDVMGKSPARSKLTPKRKAKIEARLKEGYSVADLKAAIDGCKRSAWHMGENDRGQPYNGVQTIFRDGETVEGHIERAAGNNSHSAEAPRGAAYKPWTPTRLSDAS